MTRWAIAIVVGVLLILSAIGAVREAGHAWSVHNSVVQQLDPSGP